MGRNLGYDQRPSAHPGLHVIALIELAKGIVASGTSIALALFGPTPVRELIQRIADLLHFDPDRSAMAQLIAQVTSDIVWLMTAAIGAYALLRFALFWGLWRVKAWASWLGSIAVTLYLPFCLYGLWRYPGWPTVAALTLNMVIVWVLVRDLIKRRRAAAI